jgi:hypothetical protein
MFAYQLMAEIAREPERYKGKRYKVTEGNAIHLFGSTYRIVEVYDDGVASNCMTLVGVDGDRRTANVISITSRTELDEINQPVPFMEAAKAFDEGKKVTCKTAEHGTRTYKKEFPNGTQMIDHIKIAVSTTEILRGEWTIVK